MVREREGVYHSIGRIPVVNRFVIVSLLAAALPINAGCTPPAGPVASPPAPKSEAPPPARQAAAEQDETPVLADDCPAASPPVNEEIAAQATALVPLKPGLTLATAWHRATQDDDVECLTQIHDIDANSIAASANCSMSTGTQGGTRRTCRSDLRSAHMYYTGAGDEQDVLRGTTMFSLSTKAFNELKSTGRTRHRFVTVSDGKIIGDLDGALDRQATGTVATIVNDRIVELPVVRATGSIKGTAMGKPTATRITAAIVDDERFPLVLDYAMPDIGSAGFSVRYTRISFPTDGQLEQTLASEQRVDIYGIYFDVNSDRLRPESDPVLGEIADALEKNSSWRLEIDGHTDSVGGAEANLDLSRRRAEAVRRALVTEHRVDDGRLSVRGRGATNPKDTNGTADGRARNRRVELVRR